MKDYDLKKDSGAWNEGVSEWVVSCVADNVSDVCDKNKLVNVQGNNCCLLGVGVAHLLY
jgi:hypothetical protein